MMQNSGLGNAVNPLASLTHTLRIPVLLIVTLRGDPALRDEPQHELMGAITERMLEELRIPLGVVSDRAAQIAPALARACAHLDARAAPLRVRHAQGKRRGARRRARPRRAAAAARPGGVARRGDVRPRSERPSRAAGAAAHRRRHAGGRLGRDRDDRLHRPRALRDRRPPEPALRRRLDGLRLVARPGRLARARGRARGRRRRRRRGADAHGQLRDARQPTAATNLVHVCSTTRRTSRPAARPRCRARSRSRASPPPAATRLALEGDELGLLDELFAAEDVRRPALRGAEDPRRDATASRRARSSRPSRCARASASTCASSTAARAARDARVILLNPGPGDAERARAARARARTTSVIASRSSRSCRPRCARKLLAVYGARPGARWTAVPLGGSGTARGRGDARDARAARTGACSCSRTASTASA